MSEGSITKNMTINDVIRKYPQTIKIFNEYKVDSCCGGGYSIEETASRDAVEVDRLLRALNTAVTVS